MYERIIYAHIERFWRLKREIDGLCRHKRSCKSLYLSHAGKSIAAHTATMDKAYLMQLRLHLEALMSEAWPRRAGLGRQRSV